MKWMIAYCLICTVSVIAAQPYLNSTSIWTEHYGSCGFTGTCDFYDFTRTMDGDTLINGLSYHRIATNGTHRVYDLSEQEVILTEPFSWDDQFIREENHQWHWYRSNNGSEVLLADFDLVVGDTAVDTYCQNPLVVDHIDTVYMGNELRRRYWFRPGNNHHNYLVEGVGSSTGLFNNPCSEIGIESGGSLDCFNQDDGLVVIDTAAECGMISFVDPIAGATWGIALFPNPANDYVHVIIQDATWSGPVSVRVFNAQGQEISTHDFWDHSDMQISLVCPPGLYVLNLRCGASMKLAYVIKL